MRLYIKRNDWKNKFLCHETLHTRSLTTWFQIGITLIFQTSFVIFNFLKFWTLTKSPYSFEILLVLFNFFIIWQAMVVLLKQANDNDNDKEISNTDNKNFPV